MFQHPSAVDLLLPLAALDARARDARDEALRPRDVDIVHHQGTLYASVLWFADPSRSAWRLETGLDPVGLDQFASDVRAAGLLLHLVRGYVTPGGLRYAATAVAPFDADREAGDKVSAFRLEHGIDAATLAGAHKARVHSNYASGTSDEQWLVDADAVVIGGAVSYAAVWWRTWLSSGVQVSPIARVYLSHDLDGDGLTKTSGLYRGGMQSRWPQPPQDRNIVRPPTWANGWLDTVPMRVRSFGASAEGRYVALRVKDMADYPGGNAPAYSPVLHDLGLGEAIEALRKGPVFELPAIVYDDTVNVRPISLDVRSTGRVVKLAIAWVGSTESGKCDVRLGTAALRSDANRPPYDMLAGPGVVSNAGAAYASSFEELHLPAEWTVRGFHDVATRGAVAELASGPQPAGSVRSLELCPPGTALVLAAGDALHLPFPDFRERLGDGFRLELWFRMSSDVPSEGTLFQAGSAERGVRVWWKGYLYVTVADADAPFSQPINISTAAGYSPGAWTALRVSWDGREIAICSPPDPERGYAWKPAGSTTRLAFASDGAMALHGPATGRVEVAELRLWAHEPGEAPPLERRLTRKEAAALEGYWPLADGHGAVAEDASGNDRHARVRTAGQREAQWSVPGPPTAGAPLRRPRLVQRAVLQLPGGGAHVRLGSAATAYRLVTSALTVEAWVRPAATALQSAGELTETPHIDKDNDVVPRTGHAPFVVLGCAEDDGTDTFGWLLGLRDGHFCMAVAPVEGNTARALRFLRADEPCQANRWYHVAGAADGLHMALYVDGRLCGLRRYAYGDRAADISQPRHGYLGIGGYRSARVPAPGTFSGAVAELRLWNHVRTPGQIRAAMHDAADPDAPGLAAYWPLDDGNAPVAPGNRVDSAGPFEPKLFGAAAWPQGRLPVAPR